MFFLFFIFILFCAVEKNKDKKKKEHENGLPTATLITSVKTGSRERGSIVNTRNANTYKGGAFGKLCVFFICFLFYVFFIA